MLHHFTLIGKLFNVLQNEYATKLLCANERELAASSVMSRDAYKSLTGGEDMCKGHLKSVALSDGREI